MSDTKETIDPEAQEAERLTAEEQAADELAKRCRTAIPENFAPPAKEQRKAERERIKAEERAARAAVPAPKTPRGVKILRYILFVLFLFSIAFGVVGICIAPNELMQRMKGDYVLIVLQSVVGIVVMFLPSLLERKLKIDIPTFMEVAFVVFLYMAIFLGEVREYYYKNAWWDDILHSFSAMMIGAVGFSLVNILNKSNKTSMKLSPGFVALFAFCFALALDALWEVYEFSADQFFGTDMQKYIPPEIRQLLQSTGPLTNDQLLTLGNFYHNDYRYALMDTMSDVIIDAIGAGVIAVLGYLLLKFKKPIIQKLFIKNLVAERREAMDEDAAEEMPEPACGAMKTDAGEGKENGGGDESI